MNNSTLLHFPPKFGKSWTDLVSRPSCLMIHSKKKWRVLAVSTIYIIMSAMIRCARGFDDFICKKWMLYSTVSWYLYTKTLMKESVRRSVLTPTKSTTCLIGMTHENGLSESSYHVRSGINPTNPSVILEGSLISLASNAISHVLPWEGVGQERSCACHMTSHLLPRYLEWVELDHMLAMWPRHSLSGIFTCYLNIGVGEFGHLSKIS